jgi:fused signal recognition particle receptor
VAACDTFRAGAVEQLQQWADRAEVDLYGPSEQTKSPAAVLYNALDKAVAENYDTLLVDTSGRLSNNEALTAELVKMKKVIQKRLSVENDSEGKPVANTNVPHESLLVLDAAQGRMALDSARVWDTEVGLTGLILTKLDGSARGGSVVAVSRDLNLPVKLIGVGEGIDDLRDVRTILLWSSPERLIFSHLFCVSPSLNLKCLLTAFWESAPLVANPLRMKALC